MRSGSSIWLSVAGPFAQLRPRLPGWAGLPSNFWIWSVCLSTYARRPHAASQLKQIVGIVLLPVLPALDRRIRGEPALGLLQLARDGVERFGRARRAHESGTAWP